MLQLEQRAWRGEKARVRFARHIHLGRLKLHNGRKRVTVFM